MEHSVLKDKIVKLAEAFLKEEFDNQYFIVDMDLSASAMCRLYIDGVEAVSFQTCRKLSRHLESHLDENLWLGEKYRLEVSSPGADKALTDTRQFAKHVGRDAVVTEVSGNEETGTILSVDNSTIVLETKNKKEVQLLLKNIDNIKIEISFKR